MSHTVEWIWLENELDLFDFETSEKMKDFFSWEMEDLESQVTVMIEEFKRLRMTECVVNYLSLGFKPL